ncbi:hypothetical protein WOSG25_050040 [Weissella oryzae SG25]|uniref:Uncharacterized protein n=1 Tax=Weissella oryzae (strain DSM 25784 / JCM 18191 / LMG 30913 / SG25) TaxID=1329250 RepID=A0A069CTK4_WEIOS|nr:hypothetical protein [Weissella oryzae]GAK30732.1 hypothetical protein WOSG25_050040 [Weissella oryzae SG25]
MEIIKEIFIITPLLIGGVHISTPHIRPTVRTPTTVKSTVKSSPVKSVKTSKVAGKSANSRRSAIKNAGKSSSTSHLRMTKSYSTSNGLLKFLFWNNVINGHSNYVTLEIKDAAGKKHKVNLTKAQYQKIKNVKDLTYKNGHLYEKSVRIK